MKIFRFLSLSLFFLVICQWGYAQDQMSIQLLDKKASFRSHQVDITKMVVDVSFEPEKGKVIGSVEHHFSPLRQKVDTLFWDGPGIQIQSATLDGKRLDFSITTQGVVTRFNSPLTWDKHYVVRFEYEATPLKGIYFIGWNQNNITDPVHQTRKQIWTQGQGIDNRYWIPMYDHMNDKFITETITTFDSKYKVLSNGALKDKKINKNGTTTWHYAMPKPHAGYLLMLGIGEYNVKSTKTSRGTPVQFWYYPEHEDKVEFSSIHTEKMIEFLEDETGVPYAWGSYAQIMVQDFIYGAMENTSATIFGDFFNVDEYSFNDRNYIGVNAHELTHQWFGDLITARTPGDVWLQESFATYYAKLFFLSLDGENEFKWNQYNEFKRALKAGTKDNYPVRHTNGGTTRFYPKGSTVIQMLRQVVGDEAFKRVIKYYLTKHQFGNVETNDFKQAFEDELGMDISWFFDQWVWRGDEPHFKVSVEDRAQIFVNVEQIQPQNQVVGVFKMPLTIRVKYTDGSFEDQKVWVEDAKEQYVFDRKGKSVDYIIFDLNNTILKELSFNRSSSSLISQSLTAENMIDRLTALEALSDVDVAIKRETLLKIIGSSTEFYAVKSEAVKQLSNDDDSRKQLMNLLQNEAIKVVRTYVSNRKEVGKDDLPIFMKSLSAKSYINISTALNAICNSSQISVEQKVAALNSVSSIRGQSQNVRIPFLIHQYRLTSNKDLTELINYLGPNYEFRTRLNAISAVQKIGILNKDVISYLLEASVSNNRRLGNPAISVLNEFSKTIDNQLLIKEVLASSTFTKSQLEKLSGLKAKL